MVRVSAFRSNEEEIFSLFDCSYNKTENQARLIVNSVNNHDKLIDILERINNITPDNGRSGCTWGDTDFDSLSVVFGYNLALEYIQSEIKDLLTKLKKETK